MESPTRAAVYLRISLDRAKDGLAVERQREDCEQIVKQRGWILTNTYVDNSVSAFNRSKVRPAYNQMISDYEAGLFDAIVCWDLDRLTRQPRQLEDWIDLATDRGLILVTANGEADLTTDGGRMYARIKASVARAEMERKGARQTRALQQRAQKGVAPKGQRLYGYTTSGDLVASESDVVRQLFVDFSQGISLFALAKKLNEAGTPTLKGGRWIPSTIRGMLTNPRYAARAVYKNVVLDNPANWQAAIDEGTFDLVQSILNDPRRVKNREGTQRKHLGSGLYVCGICGTPLRTNGSRYWCHSGGHLIRSMQPVDDYVMAVVAARLGAYLLL